MTPTITDPDIAELKRAQDTIQSVSELFTAVAAHSATVALVAEVAVKTDDPTVIRSITQLLDSITKIIDRNRKPQMELPRLES